jgi:hypothetical protein
MSPDPPAVGGDRGVEALGERARRCDEHEVLAHVPERAGQPFGAGGHGVLVPAGDDGHGTVARLVGPRVPDPDRGVEHAGLGLHDGHLGVQRGGRFEPGRGLLAGEQHGDRDPRLHRALRPGRTGGEHVDEVPDGALLRLHGVLVRGHPVAGDQVDLVGELGGDVAVQVHRRGHDDVGTDHRADATEQVGLGVVQTLDDHRAVDVVPEAVHGRRRHQ